MQNNLNEQLNRYGLTAKAQINQGKSLGDYAGYAAAVGAGLALAGGADAAIIYSGVQNLTVQKNPAVGGMLSAPVALFGGASNAIEFAGMLGGVQSVSHFKYLGGAGLRAGGGAKFMGTGGYSGSNLAAGALIGPGGVFSANAVGRVKIAVNSSSSVAYGAVGKFLSSTTGFAGIRLGNGDYGWIRLSLSELGLNQPFSSSFGPVQNGQGFPDKITVIDWAYDDSGAAIHAGDTTSPAPVPEPSTLALLAAGAAGLARLRRRQAH